MYTASFRASGRSAIPIEPGAVSEKPCHSYRRRPGLREQVDVSAGGSHLPDAVQQGTRYRVAQTASLVPRKHRHIDNVEVPTPISEQASHANDLAAAFLYDMAGSSTPGQRTGGLLLGLRREPRFLPQTQVVHDGWR